MPVMGNEADGVEGSRINASLSYAYASGRLKHPRHPTQPDRSNTFPLHLTEMR